VAVESGDDEIVLVHGDVHHIRAIADPEVGLLETNKGWGKAIPPGLVRNKLGVGVWHTPGACPHWPIARARRAGTRQSPGFLVGAYR